GGRYPLLSTILMTVIPAQVAGVKTICVACPKPIGEVLGVAAFLGVENFFQIGGAQAIAALAFGTETVPKVDRIVGPGNIYVAADGGCRASVDRCEWRGRDRRCSRASRRVFQRARTGASQSS